jgi:hypothetical protein
MITRLFVNLRFADFKKIVSRSTLVIVNIYCIHSMPRTLQIFFPIILLFYYFIIYLLLIMCGDDLGVRMEDSNRDTGSNPCWSSFFWKLRG